MRSNWKRVARQLMLGICLGGMPATLVAAGGGTTQPAASKPARLQPSPQQQKLINAMERRLQPSDAPVPVLDLDPGIEGAPNPNFGQLASGFRREHEAFLERKRRPIGLLFLGDSITQGWRGAGSAVWNEYYAKYDPANFGIGGNRTQHILWRIDNGELDGITPNPKVVVLMIGTNNLAHHSDEQVVAGITRIVERIHEKLPQSKVLVLGIFPRVRGALDDSGKPHPVRLRLQRINAMIAKLDDGTQTRYLEIWNQFLAADGTLPEDVVPDQLHPNAKGYRIWAQAMRPLLAEMMR